MRTRRSTPAARMAAIAVRIARWTRSPRMKSIGSLGPMQQMSASAPVTASVSPGTSSRVPADDRQARPWLQSVGMSHERHDLVTGVERLLDDFTARPTGRTQDHDPHSASSASWTTILSHRPRLPEQGHVT